MGIEVFEVGLHHMGSMLNVSAGGTESKVTLCEVEVGLGGRHRWEGSSILVVEGRVEVLECHVAWFMG